jgi:hypothetical protein
LAIQPSVGLGLLLKIRLNFLEASQQFSFLPGRVLAPRPTPIPKDQASVFISPRGGVATHFSRPMQLKSVVTWPSNRPVSSKINNFTIQGVISYGFPPPPPSWIRCNLLLTPECSSAWAWVLLTLQYRKYCFRKESTINTKEN